MSIHDVHCELLQYVHVLYIASVKVLLCLHISVHVSC